jgi:hypothetical protein
MKLELFMKIPGYEEYKVSSYGRVFSIKRNKEMKQRTNHKGYKDIELCKNGKQKKFMVHRLVALTFLEDDITNKQIDHIDGDKNNNFFKNLRICSNQQNIFNTGIRKDNSSGYKGVYWDKESKKWRVQLRINGKNYLNSRYKDKEKAYEAYKEASKKYHGEYSYQAL